MSELDPVHEALERLEWADANAGGDPRHALAGDDQTYGAHGGCCRHCGGDARRRAVETRTARQGDRDRGSPERRATSSPSDGQAQVRARQPRDDEPVLRPDQVRRRGRVQAARVLVPVDGLGERQRQRDGQRHEHGDHRRGERDRRLPGRQEGVQRADRRGAEGKIPVVAYNADEPSNNRLCYIGQDLFLSGQEMGKRIVDLVPSGDVALFIATPGASNIQPRIDGALDVIKKSGKGITSHASRPARPSRPSCR